MTPPASNLQINAPETPKAPDPAKVKQFEQAWQYKNNPLARGRIEGAWNKMSSEEKQQAKDWATSKGYDWKEMKLPDPTNQISPEIIDDIAVDKEEAEYDETVVFHRKGISRRKGQLSFSLNDNTDVKSISSTYTDGLLRVKVPVVKPEVQNISIEVK
jgi:hypothetical protein